jgi:hypothetical protein
MATDRLSLDHELEALDWLARLVERCRGGDDDERRLARSISHTIEGRAGSFDEAFGLANDHGGDHWRAKLRRRRRDDAYRRLAALIVAPGLDTPSAARACVQAVDRYNSTSWPRDRAQGGGGERTVNQKHRALFDILDACSGDGVRPLGHRRLKTVLSGGVDE